MLRAADDAAARTAYRCIAMYYPYPKFEQSRHELEREQKLRNQIYLARREARERRRASRISLLTRVREVFGARREPCPPPCPELL